MLVSRRNLLVGLGGLGFVSCERAETGDAAPRRHEIAHPAKAQAKIEFFLQAPATSGPHPSLILLHGHQPGNMTPGGQVFVQWGELARLSAKGFAVAAVSLAGFGGSTGPKDFAGPFTQAAVGAVIAHLEKTGVARPNSAVVQGISLGAVTGAILAVREARIAGLVLISGAYDLPSLFANRARKAVGEVLFEFNRQTGASLSAMQDRSALLFASQIKARTLILNGAQDDRTDPAQSELLRDAIRAGGGQAESVIYADYGHAIPPQIRQARVDAFLEQFLKG